MRRRGGAEEEAEKKHERGKDQDSRARRVAEGAENAAQRSPSCARMDKAEPYPTGGHEDCESAIGEPFGGELNSSYRGNYFVGAAFALARTFRFTALAAAFCRGSGGLAWSSPYWRTSTFTR